MSIFKRKLTRLLALSLLIFSTCSHAVFLEYNFESTGNPNEYNFNFEIIGENGDGSGNDWFFEIVFPFAFDYSGNPLNAPFYQATSNVDWRFDVFPQDFGLPFVLSVYEDASPAGGFSDDSVISGISTTALLIDNGFNLNDLNIVLDILNSNFDVVGSVVGKNVTTPSTPVSSPSVLILFSLSLSIFVFRRAHKQI